MGNPLLDLLRANDKKGLFNKTQTSISYPTGFLPLDYRNGYMLQVRDLQNNIVDEYASTGIVGGSFNTVIGKAGVAKTTATIQIAANIVRKFNTSFVLHFDLEQATTYTRIRNITGMTTQELTDKYLLKQERMYIEDIFDSIIETAETKIQNRKDFEYDSGLKDEFNEPLVVLEPTVIILDSIPTVTFKDKKMEFEGGTYASRVSKALAQFYKKLTPVIKEANIIFFAINHINVKMDINPMQKTQPQLLTMKMDEALPGGNAPVYYANNIFKFISRNKFLTEVDGFDGFRVRCEMLKSRTNKAGQFTHLVYNQEIGFDPILSQLDFATEAGLVDGRNPYRYFISN